MNEIEEMEKWCQDNQPELEVEIEFAAGDLRKLAARLNPVMAHRVKMLAYDLERLVRAEDFGDEDTVPNIAREGGE